MLHYFNSRLEDYVMSILDLKPHSVELNDTETSNFTTRRVTVPALEKMLYETIPVLDHGFVRVIDYMGDDTSIVQAARVSYGKGTKHTSQDRGLIRYLMRHRHTTPFEMCDIKLHVKLPIFVARQWIRHRTASVNEYSARYSILDNEFYVPTHEHLAAQSTENNQGRGAVLQGAEADRVLDILKSDSIKAYKHYQEMLNLDEHQNVLDENKTGLARELARMNLPVNFYTQWYWKINLHNLLHFVSLRADSHAQYEIRAYAEVIVDILKAWVPTVFEAHMDYRVGGAHISKSGLSVIRKLINGEEATPESCDMSPREWRELMSILQSE